MIDYKKIVQKDFIIIILFSILFLFFFQMLSDMVERIYAYALLNLEPDENILGLLLLFLPIFLLIFWKKVPDLALLVSGEIVIISRLIEPLVKGPWIYIFSGLSVGSFLFFFPGLISRLKNKGQKLSLDFGVGLAIGVLLSILFRTANATIDLSQTGWYQTIGWILGIIATLILTGWFFKKLNTDSIEKDEKISKANFGKILGLTMGIFSIFIVIWFVFMSPTVISRWTEGNYIAIVLGVSCLIISFIGLTLWKPDLLNYLKNWMIWAWNILFTVSLTLTILVHQIFFPEGSAAYPLLAPPTTWYHHIPLAIMIITSPIIYLDFSLLIKELVKLQPRPAKIGGSFTIGGLFIVIMVFVQILPNVWGYLPPISYGFRDQFWLAFFIPSIFITLAILLVKKSTLRFEKLVNSFPSKIIVSTLLGLILAGTVIGTALTSPSPNYTTEGKTSLIVMTYNIQQGVNVSGDRNYDGQLALIREVDPDIIGFQECDPARISGGNLDVIRYFASELNMYSYYGPKTVTNTYGCAILSKYPISNPFSFFVSSDQEQIGSAQAEITIDTTVFTVSVNHPAGDSSIRVVQNNEMLNQIQGLSNVIFMGDFNYRPFTQMYNDTLVAGLIDSYSEFYGIPALDNIDHIFLSSGTVVLNSQYIERGQSDHPCYWIEIQL